MLNHCCLINVSYQGTIPVLIKYWFSLQISFNKCMKFGQIHLKCSIWGVLGKRPVFEYNFSNFIQNWPSQVCKRFINIMEHRINVYMIWYSSLIHLYSYKKSTKFRLVELLTDSVRDILKWLLLLCILWPKSRDKNGISREDTMVVMCTQKTPRVSLSYACVLFLDLLWR